MAHKFNADPGMDCGPGKSVKRKITASSSFTGLCGCPERLRSHADKSDSVAAIKVQDFLLQAYATDDW